MSVLVEHVAQSIPAWAGPASHSSTEDRRCGDDDRKGAVVLSGTYGTSASRWFRLIRGCQAPRVRLVCFPHAGGAASFFRSWAGLVPDDVELLAVRYPGREDRLLEAPAECMEELVDPLAEACAALVGSPLALFGHSMGASVAFEVAVRLAATSGGVRPEALFLSGRSGPGAARPRGLADASDEELIKDLVAMSGTNTQVLANPELRELLLPAVRADYRLVERYAAAVRGPVLDIPVFAYYGDQDDHVDADSVNTWSAVTGSTFAVRSFPGGHFYLEHHAASLVADVFTGFLRGCPGLQAGEESDSCGAGQGQPDRRQGDPASTPHGRDAAHNGQELSTVSPPR
ncbi:thioesterase II family protein [Streptomyces sp. CA-106131]|uniref:thioesterase II family protein n=1 Tax=Streptomyces sp. CA-106131 TaxID=3240045 RepID=UPI003D8F8CF5